MSADAGQPTPSTEELRRLCAAAGIDVPDADLPALGELLANYLELAERVRTLARSTSSTDLESSASFDVRWT